MNNISHIAFSQRQMVQFKVLMKALKKIVSSIENEIAKRNPIYSFSPKILEEKLKEPVADWMLQRIEKDLSFSKNDIEKTLSNIERSGQKPNAYLYRFTIRSGRLIEPALISSFSHPRLRKMTLFIKQALRALPIPDVDFLFSLHDVYEDPKLLDCLEAPVFLISKTEQHKNTILFPHVEWVNHWAFIEKKLEVNAVAWNLKKEVLFWRGSTTGAKIASGNNTRQILTQLAKKYPQDMDVAFCYLTQGEKHELKRPLSIEEQIQYKYLLAIDGNCFPGSFFWQLRSGSAVFKQSSPYLEWYYEGLTPSHHYISFSPNGLDLMKKKKWAEENDSEVQKIADRAKKFADQYLTTEGLLVYIYHLLTRYIERIR